MYRILLRNLSETTNCMRKCQMKAHRTDGLLLAVLRSEKLQLLCASSDDLRASTYVRKYSSRRHKD